MPLLLPHSLDHTDHSITIWKEVTQGYGKEVGNIGGHYKGCLSPQET